MFSALFTCSGSTRQRPLPTLAGAWFALARHFSQTEADRRRRITESYSKAVSQLASDKIEERLGGIYTLESISKESPDDYWTVMETLTAFVRERSQRNERERTSVGLEERVAKRAYFLWLEADRPDGKHEEHWAEALKREKLGEPPATDINAVLTVIKRRDERNREREKAEDWHLDLSGAVLRRAILIAAHLEGADLREAHLRRGQPHGHASRKGRPKGRASPRGRALRRASPRGPTLEHAFPRGPALVGASPRGRAIRRASPRGGVRVHAPSKRSSSWARISTGPYFRSVDLGGARISNQSISVARILGCSKEMPFAGRLLAQ